MNVGHERRTLCEDGVLVAQTRNPVYTVGLDFKSANRTRTVS